MDKLGGGQGLTIRGRHLHHYVWGVLLLVLQAVIGVGARIPTDGVRRAVPLGVGLALVADEFDILLGIEHWRFAQRDRPVFDAALGVLGVGTALAGARAIVVNRGHGRSQLDDRITHG